MEICQEEGCDRPHKTRGMCNLHYARWYRAGGAELVRTKPVEPCAVDDCERDALHRGWCRRHYNQWWAIGDPLGSARQSDEERFWAKVEQPVYGCWEWAAGRSPSGYGKFATGPKHDRRHVRAHRYAWELASGPIPEGMNVCHKCDNPPCVRRGHLFLGTDVDNVADRVAKGRSGGLQGRWSQTHNACLDCGTTSNRHKGHGLCQPCWEKKRYRAQVAAK